MKRRGKEGCESFSEIPRGRRLAHETPYVECVWRRHLLLVSHVWGDKSLSLLEEGC